MIDIKVKFRLKDFDGDPFSAMEQLEDNLFSNINSLKRKLPISFDMTLSVSQYATDTFMASLHVKDETKSLSEDVITGQVESNIESARKRGLLSIGLHDWELDIQFI